MSTESEDFVLRVKAQFVDVDAGTAALMRMESQIRRETASLVGLQTSLSMANAKLKEMQAAAAAGGKGAPSAERILKQSNFSKLLGGKIDDKKDGLSTLENAVPGLKKLGDAAREVAAKKKALADAKLNSGDTDKATVSFRQLGAAASETDGHLGGFLRSVGKLKAAGPAGVIVALIGAVVALGVALLVTAIAMTQFAFIAADAARSSRLLTTSAAGTEAAGTELNAVISDIANHSPLAIEKIAEMGRALELAHLKGRNMQVTLEAATTATSAIGEAAGKAFTSIAEKSQTARRFLLSKNDFTGLSAELEGTGLAFDDVAAAFAKSAGVSMATASMMIRRGQVSVKQGLEAMNDAVQAKFGKTVASQMLSFDKQMSKLKENVSRLFENVKIDGFLTALKKLTDYFSDANYDGYALKQTLTTIFNGVFSMLEGAGPKIGDFIDGLEIGALTLYIAFLRVRKAWNEAFGEESASEIDYVTLGIYTMAFVVGGLVAVFGALAASILIIGGFVYFAIVQPLTAIYETLKSIDLADAGMMVVKSLANGMLGGLPAIVEAIGSIASAIINGLPTALKMHSPSVILTQQAEMAAQSVIAPLEDAAPDAHRAMADLGGGRPDFSGAGAGKSGGGGRTININGDIVWGGPLAELDSFRKKFNDMCDEFDGEAPEPA